MYFIAVVEGLEQAQPIDFGGLNTLVGSLFFTFEGVLSQHQFPDSPRSCPQGFCNIYHELGRSVSHQYDHEAPILPSSSLSCQELKRQGKFYSENDVFRHVQCQTQLKFPSLQCLLVRDHLGRQACLKA
jgi:hypothetical protein